VDMTMIKKQEVELSKLTVDLGNFRIGDQESGSPALVR
jgi:hypothetical protein